MTVSTKRIFVERVRFTGPSVEVEAKVRKWLARTEGWRPVDWNPLKLAGLRIDPDRIGVTLEREEYQRNTIAPGAAPARIRNGDRE